MNRKGIYCIYVEGSSMEPAYERGDLVAASIAILVDGLVKCAAVWTIADSKDTVAERQNALNVLKLATKWRNGLEFSVVVGIADQEQRPTFLRGQDIAIGIELHGDERASLFIGDESLTEEDVVTFVLSELRDGALAGEPRTGTSG